jgi:hypothetical protein
VVLARAKAAALDAVISAYAKEKDDHLRWFTPERFAAQVSPNSRRDELVASGYKSPHGLQARMWKVALKDAYETLDRYWLGLADDLRPLIYRKQQAAARAHKDKGGPVQQKCQPGCRRHWSEPMLHYGRWPLFSSRTMAAIYAGQAPKPPHFAIDGPERQMVARILGRESRKRVVRLPHARIARSACFDANMYTAFETERGGQVVKLMGLVPAERITIPLKGHSVVKGTIRVVKEPRSRTCAVHVSHGLRAAGAGGEDAGIDIGQSEVLTDERGRRYWRGLGAFLAKASGRELAKSKRRQKLHAIRRKAVQRGDYAKARRIWTCNLGYKKLDDRRRKDRAECERLVNTAFREFFRHRCPSRFGMEVLDFRGKAKSKGMARRTAQMRMTTINDRASFLSSVAGSHRERVNAAYGSQMCSRRGYVDPKNRNRDRFVCLFCGWAGHADRVGARHYKSRIGDPEVRPWTPRTRVKTILQHRFSERTGVPPDWKPGAKAPGTVPGWAPGTVRPREDARMGALSCAERVAAGCSPATSATRSTGERNCQDNRPLLDGSLGRISPTGGKSLTKKRST